MPVFEYKCGNCGACFETLVLRSDEVVDCPRCQSTQLSKMMSACSFKSAGNDKTAPAVTGHGHTHAHVHGMGCGCSAHGVGPRIVEKKA